MWQERRLSMSGERLPFTADNTAQKQQIGRPFEAGQSGNLAGRPKGSRNKLSEAFLQALAPDFIETVRTERLTTISRSYHLIAACNAARSRMAARTAGLVKAFFAA